jgi:Domain of unknown function (DUF397)
MDLSHIEWRKATKTSSNGGNCVEVGRNLRGIVAVRDSKNPDGPKIILTPASWQTFTASVRAGEHDLA